MSFNLDDPLAGILSDGSDDSFFDDDILGKKKPAKKKSTPVAEKKSTFDLNETEVSKPSVNANIDGKKDDLFNLSGDNLAKSSVFDDFKTVTKSPIKRIVSKESIKVPTADSKIMMEHKSTAKSKISNSVDKLDILSELNAETKNMNKPVEKGKSSQSLLDDILGTSVTKSVTSTQATKPSTGTTNKSQEFNIDSILGKSDSKQTVTLNKPDPQKQGNKTENSKVSIASAKKKASGDWLGIFQDNNENIVEDDTDMPAWLGGDTKRKKVSKEDKKPKTVSKVRPGDDNETATFNEDTEKLEEPKEDPNLDLVTKTVPSSNILYRSNEDITAEGAALCLQQQESQLMIALQLKAQEEKLATMQMRQKESQRVQRETTMAQHSQVDEMLRRQAEHRRQMQSIIAAHQERITERIKALLGTDLDKNIDTIDEIENTGPERNENPHTREKKQLLQLVQSLQENHDKEIDLMETSYRRQLAFLEVSMSQAEERMRDESDKLVKYYTEKINWLEEHHHLFKKLTEDNLNSLTERHKAENEMLRLQHLENVKVLQEHHSSLMENIKNAVKHEQALIQDSASFSSELHELVNNVKENKAQCQILVAKVEGVVENTQNETHRSLQLRETQINEMIQQLKKEREYFETEKVEARDIVKMLETRLKQMTAMIEEESALIKQKKMELEFEKATFNKQTEFAKNVLKRQDEEMKMMKEDLLKEYKEKNARIDEEKAKALRDSNIVAKEKASIQTLKQELEKMKIELQAQLEEVTETRSKLNIEKQEIHMEEQRILAKSRDLDLLAKTAIDKQSQGDKKYAEAEFLQRKYEERIRRIQEHVVSLNSREKQIAKEKVALSRERLQLHNERKQIEGRQQCSLCKTTQHANQYNFEQSYTIPDTYSNVPISSGNVNSAMNAIEHDMAFLIGRSFNIRHSTGIENVHNDKGNVENADDVENIPLQATQLHAESFKDYMDPKFMMLRLDVQQVISNLDQSKKGEEDRDNLVNDQ